MKLIKRIFEYLKLKDAKPWRPAKVGWPYGTGWATYRPGSARWEPTILDTGFPSKKDAQYVCDQLNEEHRERLKTFWQR